MSIAEPPLLVCSVGGSPAPIIHGIRAHKPGHVLFICSDASASSVKEQILPALDAIFQWRIQTLADEQDLLSCVMDIQTGLAKTLEAWDMPDGVALIGDFTGGTKVMSAALVMALMERNVQFAYTGGGQRAKNGLGIVQDGEERLMHLANPWRILAFPHIQRLADTFNAGQFHEAEKLARRITERGLHPAFFTALATLSRAYALWDGFRYAEAARLFEQALALMEKEALPALASFIKNVEANALTLKTAAAELAGFLEHRRPCPHYLHDLAANALRREAQGRYDDAAARLYSLLEKAAKTALLCDYGLDTSSLTPEALPQDFLRETPPLISHDGVMQLPLFRAYQLLAALKHPLGLRFMEHQESLKTLLQTRNASLLAHGFDPVSETACAQLRHIALAFLDISPDTLTKFPKLTAADLKMTPITSALSKKQPAKRPESSA